MIVLKNAHVIDPASGIDEVSDVTIIDGKIATVGKNIVPAPGAEVIDLSGQYLSPGWIDIHVHAYGTLGFGDPDSIGIHQGVTSFIDAGGTGIKTLDECMALSQDRLTTSLYAGPHIFPMGIVGLDYVDTEDDVQGIVDTGIEPWLQWAESHPGLLRFVKVGAYSPQGPRPIDIAKGVANKLGLPLYLHIGENHVWPEFKSPFEYAFSVMQKGDIVTHMYHGANDNILDDDGQILPFVREARERGVLFDIGFGSYGFSWNVAEKALAQGLKPDFISSDLQQFNVLNPTFSLANVMSICLGLGLSRHEVIAAVTATPADKLNLSDRAGSLRPGMPADITVFKLETGKFELGDGFMRKRTVDTRFVPTIAFKRGKRVECDLQLAQDESNWFMQVSEVAAPQAADRLTAQQIAFLESFGAALVSLQWEVSAPQTLSLTTAMRLQDTLNEVRQRHALSLRDALHAVYDCFLENRFPMQMGLFLVRLERPFVLSRLQEVTSRQLARVA
ncbi:MAG: dihydroorotase [Burkholderiales bacterium]